MLEHSASAVEQFNVLYQIYEDRQFTKNVIKRNRTAKKLTDLDNKVKNTLQCFYSEAR